MKIKSKVMAIIATLAVGIAASGIAACGEVTLDGLQIDATGVKTEFVAGEEFTAANLKVTAKYSDGTTKELAAPAAEGEDGQEGAQEGDGTENAAEGTTDGQGGEAEVTYEVTAPDISAAGAREVVVSYTEEETTVTASYMITVRDVRKSLRLDTSAVPTSFNDSADDGAIKANLKVWYTQEGEERQLSSDEYTLTIPDKATAGTRTVEVAYNGCTQTFNVFVNGLVVQPSREFVENEQLVSEGRPLVVYKVENGAQTQVYDFTATVDGQTNVGGAGLKTVSVSSGGYSTSYTILVIPNVTWETHKLDFTNVSGTGSVLELYVTSRPDSSDGGRASTSQGLLVVKTNNGGTMSYKVLNFRVDYNPNGSISTFTPIEGVTQYVDNANGGKLVIVIDGVQYSADAATWHQRVLGWVA